MKAAIIADLKTNMEANIADSRRDLDFVSNVILGQGWIVSTKYGLPLDFSTPNRVATDPKIGKLAGRVVRFTREDAETVAASVVDGNGYHGKAVFVRDAILAQIAEFEEVLANLPEADTV